MLFTPPGPGTSQGSCSTTHSGSSTAFERRVLESKLNIAVSGSGMVFADDTTTITQSKTLDNDFSSLLQPKTLPRCREACEAPTIDSHFDPAYKPKLISQWGTRKMNDWNEARDAFRDRMKRRKQDFEKLRATVS